MAITATIGMVHKGDYDPDTTYALWNTVQDDGSTYAYIALTPASGKPLPVWPETSTAWWVLVARRGIDTTTQITVTIPSTAWTGASAPYEATLTVSGITTTTKGDIALASTATAAEREAARNAMIAVTGLGTDEISLAADGEKPAIDIPAVVTVLG